MKKEPELWTEIEWKNRYALYHACEIWEGDKPMDFEAYKKLIFEDEYFKGSNELMPGMDKEDYDPWRLP